MPGCQIRTVACCRNHNIAVTRLKLVLTVRCREIPHCQDDACRGSVSTLCDKSCRRATELSMKTTYHREENKWWGMALAAKIRVGPKEINKGMGEDEESWKGDVKE